VDSTPTTNTPAPATFTIETASTPALFLELHLGAVVGATAAMLGEGVGEFQDGGVTSETKSKSAKFLCELLELRRYMIAAGFSDFDSLAHRRGVEILVACDTPSATANFLVAEVMKLLEKLVRQQAN